MIFDVNGSTVLNPSDKDGVPLNNAFDVDGNIVFTNGGEQPDYTHYSYTTAWAAKSIPYSQGFDIYDDKVFWVQKSGNDTIPANCYVWNLADGSQAFDTAYVTIYSGHGNNLSFAFPKVYASHAYPPSSVYVNDVSNDLKTFSLEKTLTFNDGSADLDCCLNEYSTSKLWTIGHISGASTTWIVSKWDLSRLTINGDGTYTPQLLHTTTTPQPESNRYFQGIRHHDGILWYNSGDGSQTAYTYGIDPNTGEVLYSINHGINSEPEGLAWVYEDGEYVLYVGFQGMMMRRYTFGA